MERNYHQQDLERAIRNTAPGDPPSPDFDSWHKKYPNALPIGKGNVGARRHSDRSIISVIRLGRTIMKKQRIRFGAVAAAILLSVIFLGRGDKAWSLEQTMAAMKELKTLHIKGTAHGKAGTGDFECWMRVSDGNTAPFGLRYEDSETTFIVDGDVAYDYMPESNYLAIRRGPNMNKLKFWYQVGDFSPWSADDLLDILRRFTDDWQQTTQTDPKTGKKQIQVNCSHRLSKSAVSFVVDAQSKRIQAGQIWYNLQRQGKPAFDAHTFLYNEEMSDELFEFEVPTDAKVATEGSLKLVNRSGWLNLHERYAEEIEVLQQLRRQYPDSCYAHQAPIRMASAYRDLGQIDKAIEMYQQGIDTYPYRDSWLEGAYFGLGKIYMDRGEKDKALEAFEKCLAADERAWEITERRREKARSYIARLKEQ